MKDTQESAEEKDLEIEMEGDSYVEQLVKAAIKAYEQGFNKTNDRVEIGYTITVTTHKVARPEGNKDVAYLRLDRHSRPKGTEEDYVPQLIHQEAYVFKNLKERLNPDSPWKEQLYMSCLGRLIGAGLEWAEFMRRAKQVKDAEAKQPTEEDRLAKLGMVKAESVPSPLTEDDEKYKKWVAEEKSKLRD